ncbi:MAG: UDP-N-acetylmuramyl-tripeptide synthetase, partial [bacterium]
MIDYSNVKKIIGVGIGGEGMFYLAKFFHLLGAEVSGFNISENERVLALKKLGIKIEKRNPVEPFPKNTDIYIYTNALSDEIKEKLKKMNRKITPVEVGELNEHLISDYESGEMNKTIKDAFEKSEIAPLYKLDYSKMKYIGVTGTDGKTTTATMIYHILKDQGFKPALISTVNAKIGDEEIDTGFHVTSPAPQDLYKLLIKVEEEKCTHVIIEATSHGLSMGRLAGVQFDVVVYTNITNEHLDYHGTWENLFKAKSKLITRHLKKEGIAVLNIDDKSYDGLSKLTSNFVCYSQENLEQERRAAWMIDLVSGSGLSYNLGLNFDNTSIRNVKVELDLIGDYNISNSLAAISACFLLDVDPHNSAKALSSYETVEGRMQILQTEPYRVIVDFAHTPNALQNALSSVKKDTKGKLIVVFGCAGQRDKH